MATVQSLAATGVMVTASVDPKDDTLIDVTLTVKAHPGENRTEKTSVESVGYAIYDRPIDDTFCRGAEHTAIPVVEQKWTREPNLRFSFRAAAVKNGYVVAKSRLPGTPEAAWHFDYIKLENIVSPP